MSSQSDNDSSHTNSQAQSHQGITLNFYEVPFLRNFIIPEGCCLIGDYHFTRGDIVLLAGPPGVGKSRAAVAAAVCGASMHPWFGLKVHQQFRTLIFQSENGIIRLHQEIEQIGECIDDSLFILEPPECGLAFWDKSFRSAAHKAIVAVLPGLIIIDPWNGVAEGDKQRDIAAAFRWIRSLVPANIKSPVILIVAHTRKPRADERSCGRALLNNVVGSYMLGSVPRAVFVMQHASDDVAEERVVMTCCKNNNGLLGSRGAWHRNGGGVFDETIDFDWSEFDSVGTGSTWRYIASILLEVGACPKAILVDELIKRYRISKSAAYLWITKAASAGLIRFDNDTQSYYAAS
jgi:AAA domain-containing protein